MAAVQVGVGIGGEGVMVPEGQGDTPPLQPQALAGSALLCPKQGAVGIYACAQLYVLVLQGDTCT